VDEIENVKKRKKVEDAVVDIVTVDKISYYSSDSEDDLFFIPTTITSEQ
jgi:hypothetical protein